MSDRTIRIRVVEDGATDDNGAPWTADSVFDWLLNELNAKGISSYIRLMPPAPPLGGPTTGGPSWARGAASVRYSPVTGLPLTGGAR